LEILETEAQPGAEWGVEEGCVPDLLVRTSEKTFIVEYKDKAATETVGAGIRVLRDCRREGDPDWIPLLVVPYMWDVGRRLCEEAGIAWMDLSGNARIHSPGLRITVEGRPNQYTRPGRQRNLFAPKASRIARALLSDPNLRRSQQDLVEITGLTKGYVSKVVARLEEAELVVRDEDGGVFPRDPNLLLSAWSEAYEFRRHEIHKGHLPIRSPQEAVRQCAAVFERCELEYAVTGLSAAWTYSQFAAFRLSTLFLHRWPDPEILSELGFRETGSGANVWLVVAKDPGVFDGREKREEIWFVSPLQAYLDLKGHPERSEEAAAELRREFLKWSGDGGD
jgi:hypothetical protein